MHVEILPSCKCSQSMYTPMLVERDIQYKEQNILIISCSTGTLLFGGGVGKSPLNFKYIK